MRFGLYAHVSGSTWLDSVAATLGSVVQERLSNVDLDDVDGLYISFLATNDFSRGVKKLKRKVRRNYTMKVITGGTRYFRCLVELDAYVADAELVAAADTEISLFEFVKATALRCLPLAFPGVEQASLLVLQDAVSRAQLPHQARW